MAAPIITSSIVDALVATATGATEGSSPTEHSYSPDWDALIPPLPILKDVHVVFLFLGTFVCFFGVFSLFIKERLYMSEAMIATVFGVIIGPHVLKYFHPFERFQASLNTVTLEVSRVVIVIQVMACGIDLPGNYILKEGWSMFMLIVPNMIIKWIVSALGIYWIVGVGYLDALIIASCLTPTDPVLANSIVKGKFAEKHIPENVRLILSAESGMNDGLGTPFLFLALYLLRKSSNPGLAIGEWLWKILIYQIFLAAAVGIIMALAAQHLLKFAVKKDWIDKESLLSFSIALALMITGVVSLFGGDDILAVFIAGNVLSWDSWFNEKMKGSQFQAVIDHLLNLAYFIYFGAVLPWNYIGQTVAIWKLVLVALWMMTIRRIPSVMALSPWIPAFNSRKEAFFAGWFGPMGASAIFYALLAIVYLDVPEHPLFEIVMFTVLTSIVFHGGSVPLFNLTLNYQKKIKLERTLTRERERERELAVMREGTDTTIAVTREGTNNSNMSVQLAPTSQFKQSRGFTPPKKNGKPVLERVYGRLKKGSNRPSASLVRDTREHGLDAVDHLPRSNVEYLDLRVSASSASVKRSDADENQSDADAVAIVANQDSNGGIESLVSSRVPNT
ncbi:hypothetical protein HDU97_008200 [Phlyctochytrium planicorne]|nr:hypothetical protein HDU97_008200 [Phlyctochytrium planicorne]